MNATTQYKILDVIEEIKSLNRRINMYQESQDTFMLGQYTAKKSELLIELSRLLIDSKDKSSQLYRTIRIIMSKLEDTSSGIPSSSAIDLRELEEVI